NRTLPQSRKRLSKTSLQPRFPPTQTVSRHAAVNKYASVANPPPPSTLFGVSLTCKRRLPSSSKFRRRWLAKCDSSHRARNGSPFTDKHRVPHHYTALRSAANVLATDFVEPLVGVLNVSVCVI